jgi:hypothetical protein
VRRLAAGALPQALLGNRGDQFLSVHGLVGLGQNLCSATRALTRLGFGSAFFALDFTALVSIAGFASAFGAIFFDLVFAAVLIACLL